MIACTVRLILGRNVCCNLLRRLFRVSVSGMRILQRWRQMLCRWFTDLMIYSLARLCCFCLDFWSGCSFPFLLRQENTRAKHFRKGLFWCTVARYCGGGHHAGGPEAAAPTLPGGGGRAVPTTPYSSLSQAPALEGLPTSVSRHGVTPPGVATSAQTES